MLYVPSSELAVRELKVVVRNHLPMVPSSHLSEALAAAAGARSHASLRASLDGGASALTYDDSRFLVRLQALGHGANGWQGFREISRKSWTHSPHRSDRAVAWRNMLVAAINGGLCQGLFDLTPTGNYWPGANNSLHGRGNHHFYDVPVPGGIPARAFVHDIGFGELAIHVAFWPTVGEGLAAGNAGFSAGEAVATGWLERTKGAWLQADRRGGGPGLSMRRNRTSTIVEMLTIPLGYADHGKFFM